MSYVPTFIDLFCGCGGMSLGFRQAGFTELAAIDFYKEAIDTFNKNSVTSKAQLQDLTKFTPQELANQIGVSHTDVIVGGPPCQGFSIACRQNGGNHGHAPRKDPRRDLFRNYFTFVQFFKPKLFVMENVLGLKTAAGGKYLKRITSAGKKLGYQVQVYKFDFSQYGICQKRQRHIILGTLQSTQLPINLINALEKGTPPSLWHLIGDLPPLSAGESKSLYNIKRRTKHLLKFGSTYHLNVLEMTNDLKLLNHVARPQNLRDLGDFAKLKPGQTSAQAMRKGIVFAFPNNGKDFLDRYTRQPINGYCSTIVAHMAKDCLMFIHPKQLRTLSVREAARIQTFPDWFEFPSSISHAYKMIGNAVPPYFAKQLALALKAHYFNQS